MEKTPHFLTTTALTAGKIAQFVTEHARYLAKNWRIVARSWAAIMVGAVAAPVAKCLLMAAKRRARGAAQTPRTREGSSSPLQVRARAVAALIVMLAATPLAVHAAPLDAAVAKGKKLLYVYNQSKLEKARAMVPAPADPKRIPSLESWRNNDLQAIAFLQSMGFTVSGADEFSPLDATKGHDLIVISESVDALEIGTKYRNLAIPLLTFENDLLGELGMTGWKHGRDTDTDDNQRFLWLVNAPHPLSGGLAAGIQNVLMDENLKMSWGKPGLGAIIVATLRGEPDKAAIFAYEKGATMYGDFLAPARRASFFLWQNNFEQMRPEGLTLFKAAVLWAVTPPN